LSEPVKFALEALNKYDQLSCGGILVTPTGRFNLAVSNDVKTHVVLLV
jgi:hypothetical protein